MSKDYKTSIVILCYNHFDLTNTLLAGLVSHEKENIDEVLIVDNGSTEPETLAGLDAWAGFKTFPITVLRLDPNVGFVRGFNAGLSAVCGMERKIVFAISNDVKIHGKFIHQAEEILLKKQRYLVGNRHIAFDSGWNTFNGKTFDYLEGYFLATTSEGWVDLGFFDERFAPMDFEDVQLSTLAKSKDYKLISLNNPNIVHAGAQTYGYTPERRTQTERNRDLFRSIWVG